ncbi:MAG TPA: S8 family serine peptidase [Propionibacteriaceae bacterium]|nr:S8 family serine peptidase [Propionibacteriaceae bacterium]
MRTPEIVPLNPYVSPKLDVFLGASDEVNRGRAEQCPSVADLRSVTAAEPQEAPPAPTLALSGAPAATTGAAHVEILPRRKVARLASEQPAEAAPQAIGFSVFVQLDGDLDPTTRAEAIKAVADCATRVRWKVDTASVEISADRMPQLLRIRGISYVEPGQPLRGPEPVVGRSGTSPRADLRRVTAESRRHRHAQDVLVGIIDVGGFDFAHSDFLDGDGRTRWVAIWDQAGTTRPAPLSRRPDDSFALNYGSEILAEHMNTAIAAAESRRMAATSLEPQSQMVFGSHGTHVASISAGNRGVARNAFLAGVVVALRPEDVEASSSFYDSTRIADAVEYLLEVAARLGNGTPLPLSINISLGTNGHAHDTSSSMARWIDNALATRGRCVCVAAGNAGQVEPSSSLDSGFIKGRIHAGGTVPATNLRQELGWIVGSDRIADVSENELEIWYGPQDRFDVELKPPGGNWIGPVSQGQKIRNKILKNGTVVSVHSESYHPANGLNRISVLLSPFFGPISDDGSRQLGPIAPGEWRIRLTGVVVRDGRFDAWIERDDPRRLSGATGQWNYPSYFAPDSYTNDRMINSLACAERLLSVANVDVSRNAVHVTSSRGPTRDGRFKPDIAAEGTDVVAACAFDRGVRWIEMTGTSMASPYVCGVAALMLAIHPELTAAQIQGIMRSTSAPLPGQTFGWRNDTGFGVVDAAACVRRTVEFADMLEAAQ